MKSIRTLKVNRNRLREGSRLNREQVFLSFNLLQLIVDILSYYGNSNHLTFISTLKMAS